MCFGRVVLWPRGEVGGNSKASSGGVEKGVGVNEGRLSKCGSEGECCFDRLDLSEECFLVEKGFTAFGSFCFLGGFPSPVAVGFFGDRSSFRVLEAGQKSCAST